MTPQQDQQPRSATPPDEASERRYRIGLCAAISAGLTGESARSDADKVQSLLLAPASDAKGAVLDFAPACRAALWRQFTRPYTLAAYLITIGLLVFAFAVGEWQEIAGLPTLIGLLFAVDILRFLKWTHKAHALLSLMPPAKTSVSAGPSALVIGQTAMLYEHVEIKQISLESTLDVLFPNLQRHYFVDEVEIFSGNHTYRLNAAAISNGQEIIDTLCARVPLTAFCDEGQLAGHI